MLAVVSCIADATTRDAWLPLERSDRVPPRSFDSERVHLEPLGPEHAQSDFVALMCSREHLRRTLGWGDWPRADFTVGENRADLQRHREEFERSEAFAYTVQSPDRARCVGCIYLNRAEIDDARAGVRLDYWVAESELAEDLDRHLLECVVRWLEDEWGFDAVLISVRAENIRGVRIAMETGFVRCAVSSSDDQSVLVHRADR